MADSLSSFPLGSPISLEYPKNRGENFDPEKSRVTTPPCLPGDQALPRSTPPHREEWLRGARPSLLWDIEHYRERRISLPGPSAGCWPRVPKCPLKYPKWKTSANIQKAYPKRSCTVAEPARLIPGLVPNFWYPTFGKTSYIEYCMDVFWSTLRVLTESPLSYTLRPPFPLFLAYK